MSKNEDFESDDEFDDDLFGAMGFFTVDEIADICNRHVEEGHEPYTKEEFDRITKWIEETSINQLLLKMVLDGGIDIVFDQEKLKKMEEKGECGLCFTLTKSKSAEMNMMEIPITDDMPKFIDLNLFRGGTKQ